MRDSQHITCAAQNQFTAYLSAAVHNYKRAYLKKHSNVMLMELPFARYTETVESSDDTELFCDLPLMQQLENERLFAAMQSLNDRDRCIFLARVLGEKSLSEVARSLGITYGAAAMSYHRTVKRLRHAVGGENHE